MYSYASVCYSYVTCMYPYVTRMFLVSTRMHPYVTRMSLVCTRMYPYVTRMFLLVHVCCFSRDQPRALNSFLSASLVESTSSFINRPLHKRTNCNSCDNPVWSQRYGPIFSTITFIKTVYRAFRMPKEIVRGLDQYTSAV